MMELLKDIELPQTEMKQLSLAMIVKNEAATIERVLKCARACCEELIVVDTGSTDNTVAIAESLGAKVYHFEWINNFAAARNFAFQHCSKDWILWLDADDVLSSQSQKRINELKQLDLDDSIDAVFMPYQLSFTAEGKCTYSVLRERLIRRKSGLKWEYPIHECIAVPYGRAITITDAAVEHRPLAEKIVEKKDRNISILEQAVLNGDKQPRNLFYYGNELRDHQRYDEAITIYQEYLEISDLDWEKYMALIYLGDCFAATNQGERALFSYLNAVAIDSSRAEAFNKAGIHFYNQQMWQQAIPFFHAALSLPKPSCGFISDADYSWVPNDYLSICYSRVGEIEKAIEFTLKALPNSPDKSRLVKNLHALADQLPSQLYIDTLLQ